MPFATDGYRYVGLTGAFTIVSADPALRFQIFEMFQTLFLHSLLPPRLVQDAEFLSGSSSIPLKLSNPTPAREERKPESGLLSTLSSYLLSPYSASNDALTAPNDEDIENTLSAIDCISSCKLDELYQQVQ